MRSRDFASAAKSAAGGCGIDGSRCALEQIWIGEANSSGVSAGDCHRWSVAERGDDRLSLQRSPAPCPAATGCEQERLPANLKHHACVSARHSAEPSMELRPAAVVRSEGEPRDRLNLVFGSDPLRSGKRLAGRTAIDRGPRSAGEDHSSTSVGRSRQNGQQEEQCGSHRHDASAQVCKAPRFVRKCRLSATSATSFQEEIAINGAMCCDTKVNRDQPRRVE